MVTVYRFVTPVARPIVIGPTYADSWEAEARYFESSDEDSWATTEFSVGMGTSMVEAWGKSAMAARFYITERYSGN
ncbi:hypothetical protein E4U25_008553 [Claviceps purpurea]|nr:hypothetical protein E4U25_008553 [Claviceps purpurea]